MNPPPTIESPAATTAATSAPDARPDRRARRVRPAHVLGGALVLTAPIMALGAPAPAAPGAGRAAPPGATPPGATTSATTPGAAAASPATAGGIPKLTGVRLSGPRLLFSLNHPATVATVAVARSRTTPVGRLDAK